MSQIIKKGFDYIAVPDRETRAFLKKKAEYGKAILKRTAQGIWEMGELLTAVKDRLPHGDYGKWVEAELGLSYETANNFVRVFNSFKSVNFTDLTVAPSVLYMLAAPSVSDETREVAMELAATGELKTTADAKAVIEAAKPQVVEGEIVESNMQNSHITPPTNPTLDNAHNDDIADDSDDDDPFDEVDGYGRPVNAHSTPAMPPPPAPPSDDAPVDEQITSLPLYIALQKYAHGGRKFADQASIWHEQNKVIRTAHAALNHIRYTSGPVTEAIKTLANIPDPSLWEGCSTCKGSLRQGERNDPCHCGCGFTVYAGQGVSADAVSSNAE